MYTSKQIADQKCLQTEKKVSFNKLQTTGGASENFTNLIIKENLK